MFDRLVMSKILLLQHFCLCQAKNVFEPFQKHYATNSVTFACQAVSFERGQTVKHLL